MGHFGDTAGILVRFPGSTLVIHDSWFMIFWSLNRWGQGQGEDLLLPLCQLNGCLDGESQQTRNFRKKTNLPWSAARNAVLPRGIACRTLCFSSSAALICARSTWNTSQPKHDKVTWSNFQNTFSWRSLYFNAYLAPASVWTSISFSRSWKMAGNVCQSKSDKLQGFTKEGNATDPNQRHLSGFTGKNHSSMLICSCCFRFSRLYLEIYNLRQRPQICPWMCLETPKVSGSRSFVSWIPGHKFSVFCVSCCFKRLTSRNSNTTTTQDAILFRIQSCWKIMNSNCPLVNPVIGWKIHQKKMS